MDVTGAYGAALGALTVLIAAAVAAPMGWLVLRGRDDLSVDSRPLSSFGR